MASTAMAAGNAAQHGVHAASQLKHAASATALGGGLAGGVGALPTPNRILGQNPHRNLQPKIHRTRTGAVNPPKGYTTATIGKATTMTDAFRSRPS